jgi:putative endonuclease
MQGYMSRQYYVYIITNIINTVLYTGVTNDIVRRLWEHKQSYINGFSKQYNLCKLVYYEVTDSIESAIIREKQIKKWRRQKKNDLISKFNSKWRDLYNDLLE